MSNGPKQEEKARLFDLASKVLELVREGKRDPKWVANVFQAIVSDDMRMLHDSRIDRIGITAQWLWFYEKYFGLRPDFLDLRIPDDPGGFSRVLVLAPGLTLNKVFAACASKFPVWKHCEDLDRDVNENERDPRNGSYAILVRDRVEADEELANWSVEDIKKTSLKTETLLERLIYELKYWDETGKHLDLANLTLCSGSRHSDGHVPVACWNDDEFRVDWYSPQDASSLLRARAVVQ